MPLKLSKRMKYITKEVDVNRKYSMTEAFKILKKVSLTKFSESIDVAIKLGVDLKKSDQIIKGYSVFPNGLGSNNIRIAVLASDLDAISALKAGADIVGMENLILDIKNGIIDFDVLVCSTNTLNFASKLGSILGPIGLMPSVKFGTVSDDIFKTVKNIKRGQVFYKTDIYGVIHSKIGIEEFEISVLEENLVILLNDLKSLRPISSKGVYFESVVVSSTMGPGLVIDMDLLKL